MYKHVYTDFIKDEKEKIQYQDIICRTWWQTLRSAVRWQSIQPLHSQVRRPLGISTHGKTILRLFLSCWQLGNISLSFYECYFVSSSDLCHLPVVGIVMHTCTKIVTGLPWEIIKFNLLCGRCTLLLFPSALIRRCHYALLPSPIWQFSR